VGSDSGQRQLADIRQVFEASRDAARQDLERVERMLARMDRIEAMLASSEERADGGATEPSPARALSVPAPRGAGTADVEAADADGADVHAARGEAADVEAVDIDADARDTAKGETSPAVDRRGGRASLRDSPLAHLFRPTDSRG